MARVDRLIAVAKQILQVLTDADLSVADVLTVMQIVNALHRKASKERE